MKKLFRTGFMTALAVILATGWCYAATIMFPYINSNPGNLSTIVNVINTLDPVVCADPKETLQLHYRYMTKEVTASATDACEERDFWRPTTMNDLVTFDAAGDINSGEAMFNDATAYDIGAGAPGFDLPNMGLTDARRGYMLVTHKCSGITGEIPGVFGGLDGEVMLLDVVNGAAWGYQAVVADPQGVGPYAFASALSGDTNPVTGATTELLSDRDLQVAAIYPPDEFQTRFFVTPLVIHTLTSAGADLVVSNNMADIDADHQKRTRIALRDSGLNVGVTDRDESPASGGAPVGVRCVAGIDLNDLTGGSFGPWYDAQGGWAFVGLMDPDGTAYDVATDHSAIVIKLQFGSPSFASGMINSCSIIRTDRIED